MSMKAYLPIPIMPIPMGMGTGIRKILLRIVRLLPDTFPIIPIVMTTTPQFIREDPVMMAMPVLKTISTMPIVTVPEP